MDIFNLEIARPREAERCLTLLGACAQSECDDRQLRLRSRETFVPVRNLAAWRHNYLLRGFDGLLPVEWSPLDAQTQLVVQARLDRLAGVADKECLTFGDVKELAERNNWSSSTAERWIRRYRIGGLWALAPRLDPSKKWKRAAGKLPPSALATLELGELDEALDEIERRYRVIEPLLGKAHVSREDVEKRAKKMHVSPRTVRYYLQYFREYGRAGLLSRTRSDKGSYHNLSERMMHIIGGLRLSKYDRPLSDVLQEACKRARLLGEPEPSEWQVRAVIKAIPQAVLLLADGRRNEYRNKYRVTYRRFFDGSVIIYQIDWTPVPILVKDIRRPGTKKKRGETRPNLVLCVEASSRLVVAAWLTYDTPDQFTIASVIREALLVTDEKPYGGIPDEIWVDRGKQMISKHVQFIARDLDIVLHPCIPNDPEDRGNPQENGIVERLHQTLEQRIWSTLDGYVGSNTVERNPNAQAKLTIAELAEKFWAFIAQYHREVHAETGMTPLDYWMEHCHTLPPDDESKLDMLLQVRQRRRLLKEGIKYANRVYWDDCFGDDIPVGADVLIRAQPAYLRPDEIQVYYQRQRVCTAVARDSEEGRTVTGERVAKAQWRQKASIEGSIKEELATLREADREIEQLEKARAAREQQPTASESPTAETPQQQGLQPPKPPQQAPADAWDWLLEMQRQSEVNGGE
jgi:putative transposase